MYIYVMTIKDQTELDSTQNAKRRSQIRMKRFTGTTDLRSHGIQTGQYLESWEAALGVVMERRFAEVLRRDWRRRKALRRREL
ncbi:hypothetical protein ACFX19_011457 [Malus domestica]